MKIPNQTKPVERKVNSQYNRAVGGVDPSFSWGDILNGIKKVANVASTGLNTAKSAGLF